MEYGRLLTESEEVARQERAKRVEESQRSYKEEGFLPAELFILNAVKDGEVSTNELEERYCELHTDFKYYHEKLRYADLIGSRLREDWWNRIHKTFIRADGTEMLEAFSDGK